MAEALASPAYPRAADGLDPVIVAQLMPHLRVGETLLWVGRPDPWRYAFAIDKRAFIRRAIDLVLVVFLFWAAPFMLEYLLSLKWIAVISPDSRVAPLDLNRDLIEQANYWIAIVFGFAILIALWPLLKPLWRWFLARGVLYGVTNKRAIEIVSFTRRVESIPADRISTIETRWHGNSLATVMFFDREHAVTIEKNHERNHQPGLIIIGFGRGPVRETRRWTQRDGFIGVANAQALDHLLSELAEGN